MRLDTEVWMKFESKGKPALNRTFNGTVMGGVRELLAWITTTPMGHCMKLTVARSEVELEKLTREGGRGKPSDKEAMMAEFAAELDSLFDAASTAEADTV